MGSARASAARRIFVADADRICRRAHVAVGRVGRRLRDLVVAAQRGRVSRAGYMVQAADLTAEGMRIAGSALGSLRSLPDPGDALFTSYMRFSAMQVTSLGAQAEALRRGELRTVGRLSAELVRNGHRVRDFARRFGFHACGGA